MVTEKTVKELENSQASLTLTVDAESIEKAYSAKLAKYSKEIEMPGFRKGHVPASVIERKYGQGIREESTFDCMEENLKQTIETLDEAQKPLPYSTPVLQDEEKLLPFKKDQAITFTVIYDVMPKIELPAYTGLTVSVKEAEVSDADIDAEIKSLQEQNAMVVTKKGAAAEGDIVTVDYAELDAEGKPVANTERKDFTFTIGSGYNFYKLDKDIVGMQKGDEKKIEKSYTAEDKVPGYEGKTVTLDVKVTEVKVRELPEVDDDFAQDVKDEYKTVADLKAGLKAKLEKNLEDKMKNNKADAVVKAIADQCKIDVPASMVEAELSQNWDKFVQQSGLPEEQLMQFFKMQNQTKEQVLEGWREPAKEDLKRQLILEEIKKKENFEVSEEELNKACEEQLKDVKDEKSKEYYKTLIKDDLQFAKVVPFLLEKNTFTTAEKVSYKEFMEPSAQE